MTQPKTENKIVLVTRKTRLDELVARFNSVEQARFYVEHLGADFSDYLAEDEHYKQAASALQRILLVHGRTQIVDRMFLPNFLFGKDDTVIALGQDGLVANTLKYLNGQQMVGVNPDPVRWEGVLLPFSVVDIDRLLPEVFAKTRPIREITIAQAKLNDGQIIFGVNDIFIGPRSHTSARYQIQLDGKVENHSSSGIIVSTGLGSTGWMRSVIAGATNVANGIMHTAVKVQNNGAFAWDSQFLQFSVREPWPSNTTGARITFGKIGLDSHLTLVSQMPEHGVIFSDGIESDFLKFNSGATAHISLAEKRGFLVS